MGWWSNAWVERTHDWIFASITPGDAPEKLEQTQIEPDTRYLSIFLRSMRVVNVRKGFTRFYGTVHSFIELPHLSGEVVKFHVLTTHSTLSDIDRAHVDRVINFSRRLLGPIPYRGGDLGVEVGLFSVKSADLAKPFLTVLEGLSDAAGVTFFGVAKPFIDPLLQGVNLLFGTQGDNVLEVGLARAFNKPKTGYFLVMRASEAMVDVDSLSLDSAYRLIDSTKNLVTRYPYLVLSIEASEQRDDWFLIPEVSASYSSLKAAVRDGTIPDIRVAWEAFERIVKTSPDLISKDAKALAQKVYVDYVKGNLKGPILTSSQRTQLPDLNKIDLYDSSKN